LSVCAGCWSCQSSVDGRRSEHVDSYIVTCGVAGYTKHFITSAQHAVSQSASRFAHMLPSCSVLVIALGGYFWIPHICMYVSMYVSMNVYIYICIYVCICVCIYVSMYVSMYVYPYFWIQ